jgi:hypothetical protein
MFKAATEPFPEGMKICPIQSDATHRVLCQRSNCYAAYPVQMPTGTFWFCKIIDGKSLLVLRRDHDE